MRYYSMDQEWRRDIPMAPCQHIGSPFLYYCCSCLSILHLWENTQRYYCPHYSTITHLRYQKKKNIYIYVFDGDMWGKKVNTCNETNQNSVKKAPEWYTGSWPTLGGGCVKNTPARDLRPKLWAPYICSWEYLILVFNTHWKDTRVHNTHTWRFFDFLLPSVRYRLFFPRFALEQLSHEPDMRRERLLSNAVVTLLSK